MMLGDELITSLARKSAVKREPRDYIQDGLLYCGHCKTPKQCRISYGGGLKVVGCQCACRTRQYEAQRKADQDRERALHIEALRASGIQDRSLAGCRFAGATETPELARCRRYVTNWETMYADNNGLLFWGNTGNGKTFAAACIANELIDRGIPTMITSFPRILNAGWDRREIAEQMKFYPLLVIDDLGAERSSEYALETVYMVIDERYKAKKPLIVTTNLTLDEICKPKNMDYQRIYDRILEMCIPVVFQGSSMRRNAANEKFRRAKAVLDGQ